MRQRGRKSAAQLSVVAVAIDRQRPSPPPELTPAQAKVWKETVDTTPPGWFRAGDVLLGLYCRHVESANFLAGLINNFDRESGDLRKLNRLLTMRHRETMTLASLATKMRLTPQARMHPRTAGRAMDAAPVGPRPWES